MDKGIRFLLPVRDLVIFPKSITSVMIGREKSLNILQDINISEDLIFIVSQKNNVSNNITLNNLNTIGVLCRVLQKIDVENNQKRIIIEGV